MAYAIGTRPGTSPVVDGLYERLLDRAEKTCAGPDPRLQYLAEHQHRVYVDPSGGAVPVEPAYAYPRGLSPRLTKMLAGDPVVVAGFEIGGGTKLRERLPWIRGEGVLVRVWPDDTIEPATDVEHWDSPGPRLRPA